MPEIFSGGVPKTGTKANGQTYLIDSVVIGKI